MAKGIIKKAHLLPPAEFHSFPPWISLKSGENRSPRPGQDNNYVIRWKKERRRERNLEKKGATLPGNEDIFFLVYVIFSPSIRGNYYFSVTSRRRTDSISSNRASSISFLPLENELRFVTFPLEEPRSLFLRRPELQRSIFPIGSIDQTFLITLRDEKSSLLFGIRIDRSSLQRRKIREIWK